MWSCCRHQRNTTARHSLALESLEERQLLAVVIETLHVQDDGQFEVAQDSPAVQLALDKATNAQQPVHGTIERRASGQITYTPDVGFLGFDSFQYTTTSNQGTAVQRKARLSVIESAEPKWRPNENLDLRFSAHAGFSRLGERLASLDVSTNVLTLLGAWVGAARGTKLDDFLSMTQGDVEQTLRNGLAANRIDAHTGAIVILDIEHPISPADLHAYLGDADQFQQIVDAFRVRIAAVRAVMPNAELFLYGVVIPDRQGRYRPSSGRAPWQTSFAGYERAAALGMFDDLDGISPNLYGHHFKLHKVEAATRQAMIYSSKLAKSNGSELPLVPMIRIQNLQGDAAFENDLYHNPIVNSASRDVAPLLPPSYLQAQLDIVSTFDVQSVVVWAPADNALENGSHRGLPRSIDHAHYLAQVLGKPTAFQPFTNPPSTIDLDGDGQTGPTDAIYLFGVVRKHGFGPMQLGMDPASDVNRDGFLSPIDLLTVINAIDAASQMAPVTPSALRSADPIDDEDAPEDLILDQIFAEPTSDVH